MVRAILILSLILVSGLTACGRSFTYTSYEVIHSPKYLEQGDQVRIIARGQIGVTGTIIRVEDETLIVAVEGEGERSFTWQQIKVIERVERTKARR